MTTFDVLLSVLLPALSPAPEAMAGATRVWGATWLPRESDPTRRHRPMIRCRKVSLRRLSWGRAGSSRDMWFHHPSYVVGFASDRHRSQAAPNGMERTRERKARRAYRSVLDLVVATCTAVLAGAMSVVPPDPRRVAGVVPSASRPCPDALCTGESRRRQRGATCDLSELDLRSQRRRVAFGGDS